VTIAQYRVAVLRRWLLLIGVIVLTLLAACSGSPDPTPTGSGPGTYSITRPATDASICPPAQGPASDQGAATGGTLFALFFVDTSGWVAGNEIKVVWRMTGSGGLTMTAAGPDGRSITPAWGPEAHTSSTFNRPGDEWGTGWVFPVAGCWTFHATRTGGQAGLLAVRVE
jgi:hypothetical protein